MRKIIIFSLSAVLLLAAGCARKAAPVSTAPEQKACTMEAKMCPDGSYVGRSGANCEFAPCPESKGLSYENGQYGFALQLAADWEGYSVSTSSIEYGTKVLLRHPKWTEASHYEDIPVLVYPIAKWQAWEKNDFEGYPTAAPIGPTERGRNDTYVFATAPRYNYDFSTGWEEAEDIIKTLKTVDISEADSVASPEISAPVITGGGVSGSVGIANPASTYCVQHGGELRIVTDADGSQRGDCILPSGKTCDEWAYFRNECK